MKICFSQIDIFIGGLEENLNTQKHLVATRFYYYDKLTWCVQKSQLLSLWTKISSYGCSDPRVFIFLSFAALSAIFSGYIFEQLEPESHNSWDWNRTWLNAIRCYFGFSCEYNPTINVTRAGYMFLLFGSIICVTTISTRFIGLHVKNYFSPQVETIQEIIENQFDLVGNQHALQMLQQNKVLSLFDIYILMNHSLFLNIFNVSMQIYPRESITKFKVFEHPSDYFVELEWNNKLAVAALYEESRSKTKQSPIEFKKDIYCFGQENIIYEYSLRMLARKDFPLLNDLNIFIRRVSECGLIDKWLKSYRSLEEDKNNRLSYSAYKLENLYFLLVICITLKMLALMTFILEKTTFRKIQTPHARPFWRYVEIIIDPYRHFFLRHIDWSKHTISDLLKP